MTMAAAVMDTMAPRVRLTTLADRRGLRRMTTPVDGTPMMMAPLTVTSIVVTPGLIVAAD